jgi:3-hydroxy acid dehydrogenase / malonic semialdehyde reductase
MLSLKGKIVCITGASSGIGEACAIACAREGAALLLIARRREKLEALSRTLSDQYAARLKIMLVDVTKAAAIDEAFSNLPPEWQSIDILINNAGLALGRDSLDQTSIADCDTVIDTNIKGMIYSTKAVLSGMIARKQGHIVNVGSIAGHETYAGGTVYCATKHAVLGLTKALKKDLLGTAIRVSLISPGVVKTEFNEVRFKGDHEKAAAVYAHMKPLTAEDIAESIIFCLTRPLHVNVSEIIILPTDQASIGEVHRKSP